MLLQFLYDFEAYINQEEKVETFKQSLIQAFPTAYDKIYPKESSGGVPEGYEQKAPETDEEFEEIQRFLSMLSGGQKTLSLDQLIEE
jgi:hypothetical protein